MSNGPTAKPCLLPLWSSPLGKACMWARHACMCMHKGGVRHTLCGNDDYAIPHGRHTSTHWVPCQASSSLFSTFRDCTFSLKALALAFAVTGGFFSTFSLRGMHCLHTRGTCVLPDTSRQYMSEAPKCMTCSFGSRELNPMGQHAQQPC
jgi:hypothetical protein